MVATETFLWNAGARCIIFSYAVPEWKKQRKNTRRQYLKDLALVLVLPFMKQRLQNKDLPRELKALISNISGNPLPPYQLAQETREEKENDVTSAHVIKTENQTHYA
ncbi:hypothetical protein ANN_15215 [Periplaneta americana]|uniref:Uncharacterized protein n=1 Tax=Periplaneta americana TaxID=6978 RepID=A0ABQ8SFR3_PERAM|nr:hypothetical protein ANN_15215 [Periplaneta americana]